MLQLENPEFASQLSGSLVNGRANRAYSSSMIDAVRSEPRRQKWQALIENTLLAWLKDPSQLEDEGVECPSASTIRLSLDVAERFRDSGKCAPLRITPDPNGGVVFERRQDNYSDVIHIWDNGAVEYFRFQGSHLEERKPLRF